MRHEQQAGVSPGGEHAIAREFASSRIESPQFNRPAAELFHRSCCRHHPPLPPLRSRPVSEGGVIRGRRCSSDGL